MRRSALVKGIPRAEWCRQIAKLPRPNAPKVGRKTIAIARAAQLAKNNGRLFGTGKNSRQVQKPQPVVPVKIDKFPGLHKYRQCVDDYA